MSESGRDLLHRFFMASYDQLRARLVRRLGSVELADDALQETWLRIEGSAPDGVRSPMLYLLKTAFHVALRQIRAEKRFVTLSDAQIAIGLADDVSNPEQSAMARSELEMLARALGDLTPRRRQILLWSRLDGVPLREIAERLDVSQRLVEIELKHALAHCAERLNRNLIQRFGPKPSADSQ
jgi:RNA polymerase sigma factor (sigma-70 family)